MTEPRTLLEAIRHFSDYQHCHDFMVAMRWPNKVCCPRCGSVRVRWMPHQKRWKCYEKHARPQFSLKTGTIFEDSPLGLDKWLPAIWLIVNCKNGVSSYEIARALGVTQKTGWFMGHRIRAALHAGSFAKLAGQVEVDETFIGGKARNMHASKREQKIHGRGPTDKVAVLGMIERGGRVHAEVVPNRKRGTLQKSIKRHVKVGAALFSDELKSYKGLDALYAHKVINHAVQYVNGKIHTNGIENFWSLLKRALGGTYVSVEPFHLFRYLDEQAYRFNERAEKDSGRFRRALTRIVDHRLTCDELTGKLLASGARRSRLAVRDAAGSLRADLCGLFRRYRKDRFHRAHEVPIRIFAVFDLNRPHSSHSCSILFRS